MTWEHGAMALILAVVMTPLVVINIRLRGKR